jgi:hypothetical protein
MYEQFVKRLTRDMMKNPIVIPREGFKLEPCRTVHHTPAMQREREAKINRAARILAAPSVKQRAAIPTIVLPQPKDRVNEFLGRVARLAEAVRNDPPNVTPFPRRRWSDY